MYQIKCDDYPLLDVRDEDLIVQNPKLKVAVNTVGSCSFTIHQNHPYYDKLKKLKSVFEVSDDIGVIFRGRMTDDGADFYNSKSVEIEGAMGCFNDSVVRPYNFPNDFWDNEEYAEAAISGNVVEFYLKWLIEQHNAQVSEFQQFKLGTVTVSDPNNYITRSDSTYPSTWEVLKNKLFSSELGGYLCIRYEADGNYIDYLSEFTLTNTQPIKFGENLLDFSSDVDATSVCSAVIPLGADIETTSEEGVTTKKKLTLETVSDCEYDEDIIKKGDIVYSKSAVEAYGWVYAPTASTTWEDVTVSVALLTKAVEYLKSTGLKLATTIKVTAIDLHYTDEEIQSFRIYRNVKVESLPHGHNAIYQLTELDIDLLNPQNSKITVGNTELTLTDVNARKQSNAIERIQSVEATTEANKQEISEVRNQALTESTQIINTCNEIILAALESYVETSSYEEFKETVETQLQIMADEISMNFTTVTEQIEAVNGDLQEKYNTITKYFTFDVDGLTIGQSDSPYKVVIDNDRYSMLVNDVEVLWLANGEVHTPEIEITKKMNLFGYLIEEDSNGNVNCEYVGGET